MIPHSSSAVPLEGGPWHITFRGCRRGANSAVLKRIERERTEPATFLLWDVPKQGGHDDATPRSQEFGQLGLGQSRMPEDRAERTLCDLLVIRDRDAAKGLGSLAEHDMAPLLPIDYIP